MLDVLIVDRFDQDIRRRLVRQYIAKRGVVSDELMELVSLIPKDRLSYVFFNNITMNEDAVRFNKIVSEAINLVPGEVTGRFRSYRFDRALNQIRLVLADRPGLRGDVLSDMDDSGQHVVVEFSVGNTNHLAVVDVGVGEQTIQAIRCAFNSARLSGDGQRIICRWVTVVPPPPPFAYSEAYQCFGGSSQEDRTYTTLTGRIDWQLRRQLNAYLVARYYQSTVDQKLGSGADVELDDLDKLTLGIGFRYAWDLGL